MKKPKVYVPKIGTSLLFVSIWGTKGNKLIIEVGEDPDDSKYVPLSLA